MLEEKKTRNRMVICVVTGEDVSRRKSVEIPEPGGRVSKTAMVRCALCQRMVSWFDSILTVMGRMCPHHHGVKKQKIELPKLQTEDIASE